MRIAVVGGGPGGLYFAALAKQHDPGNDIVVWERNPADDTYGFGVIFSHPALEAIRRADPELFEPLEPHLVSWSGLEIHHRGETSTSAGLGFAAIGRKTLLRQLQRRCASLGVTMHHAQPAPPIDQLRSGYDVVVAADGANSTIRTARADAFGTTTSECALRYTWLGADKPFDGLHFLVAETPHGPIVAHAYPYDPTHSTFLVEADTPTLTNAALTTSPQAERPDRAQRPDRAERPDRDPETPKEAPTPRTHPTSPSPRSVPSSHPTSPSPRSDACTQSERAVPDVGRIAELFAEELGEAELFSNHSTWNRFTVVRNERWWDGNVVLLGDAAHTVHYSIGSGTKLAMEDALVLAGTLAEAPGADGLAAYQEIRKPVVDEAQRVAQRSLEWFETIDDVLDSGLGQFTNDLLTRGGRVSLTDLRLAEGVAGRGPSVTVERKTDH